MHCAFFSQCMRRDVNPSSNVFTYKSCTAQRRTRWICIKLEGERRCSHIPRENEALTNKAHLFNPSPFSSSMHTFSKLFSLLLSSSLLLIFFLPAYSPSSSPCIVTAPVEKHSTPLQNAPFKTILAPVHLPIHPDRLLLYSSRLCKAHSSLFSTGIASRKASTRRRHNPSSQTSHSIQRTQPSRMHPHDRHSH